MASCNLSKSNTPGVDFDGAPGKVTLKIKGTEGDAFFEHVIYNGNDVLTTVAQQVDVNLVAGQTTLVVVCIFTDQANGAGDMSEQCTGSTVLDTLEISDPDHGTRTYVISA